MEKDAYILSTGEAYRLERERLMNPPVRPGSLQQLQYLDDLIRCAICDYTATSIFKHGTRVGGRS
jgi:hypothetical protein